MRMFNRKTSRQLRGGNPKCRAPLPAEERHRLAKEDIIADKPIVGQVPPESGIGTLRRFAYPS